MVANHCNRTVHRITGSNRDRQHPAWSYWRPVHFQMIQASRQSHQWQPCRLQRCALAPHVSLRMHVNLHAVTVHLSESLTVHVTVTGTVTVVMRAIVVTPTCGRGPTFRLNAAVCSSYMIHVSLLILHTYIIHVFIHLTLTLTLNINKHGHVICNS